MIPPCEETSARGFAAPFPAGLRSPRAGQPAIHLRSALARDLKNSNDLAKKSLIYSHEKVTNKMKANILASWSIIITFAFAFLILGKNLLIPFIIALLVWYVIISLSHWIGRWSFAKKHFPNWLLLTISSLIISLIMVIAGELIATNAKSMATAIPRYEDRVQQLITDAQQSFGVKEVPTVSSLLEKLDFTEVISGLINALSGIASNAFLILIYVMFLFIEQTVFHKKILALFPRQEDLDNYQLVIGRINEAIISYLSVKSLVSILTAIFSLVIMVLVGVDFAVFWAFLIFLLNFIPNIGSIVATLFPALLALLQFDTLTPFLIILLGVGAIQVVVGNMVEPRLMGDSLNISPLVVILALSLWGALWGIVGMVLSVPITVVIMIVLAQFPNTRPIAILLSKEGLKK